MCNWYYTRIIVEFFWAYTFFYHTISARALFLIIEIHWSNLLQIGKTGSFETNFFRPDICDNSITVYYYSITVSCSLCRHCWLCSSPPMLCWRRHTVTSILSNSGHSVWLCISVGQCQSRNKNLTHPPQKSCNTNRKMYHYGLRIIIILFYA